MYDNNPPFHLKIKDVSQYTIVNEWFPKRFTRGSSGLDIVAVLGEADSFESITIKPMEHVLVPTGLSFEIPYGYEAQIRMRSSLALKHQITLLTGVSTIDSDYRGEIKLPLINLGKKPYTIHTGDRIAQAVICKVEMVGVINARTGERILSHYDQERGEGGFGSTGRRCSSQIS